MTSPFNPTAIADGAELLTKIRESLRTSMQLALDGNELNLIDPRDALGLIYNYSAQTLAIIDASKDTI